MKKILFLVALVAMTFSASAQFGIKAGVNLASMVDGKDISDFSRSRAGYYFGVNYGMELSDKFTFVPELIYSSQGAKINSKPYIGKAALRLTYINLPMMFKFNLVENFSLDFGPQIGLNIIEKAVVDGKTYDLNEIGIKGDINKFDVAISVGATYSFCNFFIDGRYNYGLTKFESDFKAYNRIFQLGMGYKF